MANYPIVKISKEMIEASPNPNLRGLIDASWLNELELRALSDYRIRLTTDIWTMVMRSVLIFAGAEQKARQGQLASKTWG